jgi:hypothetical protein
MPRARGHDTTGNSTNQINTMKTRQEQFNELGDCDASPDILEIVNEIYDDLESERDDLRTALREMVAAKGRYNTMTAMEKLIALVPDIYPNH